jgi:hypothetical protein
LKLSLNPANRAFFIISEAFDALQAKSAHKTMKRTSETTWKDNPAIMILTPKSLEDLVFAPEAIAPPAACNSRDMKSQVMKRIV